MPIEAHTRMAWWLLICELGLIAILVLVASKAVWGQVPAPTDHWELGIYQGTSTSPVSMTVYPANLVRCQLPKAFSTDAATYSSMVEGPSDNIPNPTIIAFNDPTNLALECRMDVVAPVLALPVGINYRAQVRAIAADGTPSSWSPVTNTFRRAPRGQPCTMPSGATGVQLSVIADINGRLTSVALCVQQ